MGEEKNVVGLALEGDSLGLMKIIKKRIMSNGVDAVILEDVLGQ